MKAYEWWSPAEPLQAAPQTFSKQAQNNNAPTVAEPVVGGRMDALDWGLDASASSSKPLQKKKRSSTSSLGQPGRKVTRRNVIAVLATGAVAAAGVGIAFNLGKLGAAPAPQQALQQTAPTTKPAANKTTQTKQQPAKNTGQTQKQPPKTNGGTTNQPPANNPKPTQAPQQPAHMGTVIGSQTQAVNSAIKFNNPADNQASLLVHLSSGMFAAYEQACTHEGVKVNYDPGTGKLVCPAHGAIFDPANGGQVLQGPADTPLPPVKINVNGDGTITAV
ncbi:QcrA and Rieske domain-containing protein [Dictyobacter kobayashii]|uniref:Rieske domain-containing protein n=1 Tax=Dictyobacter kobayashii TaxID=2014872 RepID=A0A402AME6_9CHLR|nr:Rieske (2Fe-2S) protein [Dictyobacter kobayashii]GCE20351.1 hypothetical protein KDK_41510 [Dictyobacter kobayashii]